MNFNFTQAPEYVLNTSLTYEMIQLYGIPIQFLVTEKINPDDLIYGDWSHLKSDSDKIYDMYALPENSEEWDTSEFGLNNFGLVNFDNISLFIMKSYFDGSSTLVVTNNNFGNNTDPTDGDTGWINSWNVTTQGDVDIYEVFEVTLQEDKSGSLNSKYWLMSSPSTDYYVWYNVNSLGMDPEIPGRTGVEVQISTNASNIQVTNATSQAIDDLSDFSSEVRNDRDEIKEIVNNLIVFPNNKIMEVTEADFIVPGINNLFTYKDTKSVYKLTCKPYNFKLIHELDNTDISDNDIPYDSIDNYFDELIDDKSDQDDEADTTPQVSTVDTSGTWDTKVDKPIVDKSVESPFGEFD